MRTSYTLVAGGLFASGIAAGSPLGAEPSLGVASDYSTNPELRSTGQQAESHGALLLNVPVRYDLDNLEYSLSANARYSDARGYSSLASNYFHVDAGARDVGETGWASIHAGFNRDTSLYHSGESILGVGVRRDTRTAQAQLEHSLTERFSLQLDADWTRTNYDQRAVTTSLVDYRYISVMPSLKYSLSERSSLSLTGIVGRYNSLDQITASKSYDLQAGFERQIDEVWTLSTSAGYSRSKNSLKFYFGPFYLGDVASSQKGTVYDLSLRRKGEKFSFVGTASRALRPTGFAFLSRQDSAEILMQYQFSERLSLAASGHWHKITDPRTTGPATTRSDFGGDIAASWNWTEDWLVTLRASRVEQRYQAFDANANSTGVNLEITRQFHRVEF